MSKVPNHVRIRSYNVGFGDCFLMSFTYPGGEAKHILIDFGSTKLPRRGPKGLGQVAEKIRADSGGKLTMVVATHRHSDHISGFAGESGAIIAALEPDLVVQPWTEDPDLAPDADAPVAVGSGNRKGARALVARLSDMHLLAAAIVRQAPALAAAKRIPKTVGEQLSFLGETNLKNEDAVVNLMRMGAKRCYASFGTKLPTARLLPGVRIDVIGPPTLRQSAAIATQKQVDPDEFWHIIARRAQAQARGRAGSGERPIFPRGPLAQRRPQEARWLIPQIDRMHADELLAIVRSLDDTLNNTSLILLFQVGEALLVFPGDAQLENWSYALFEAKNAVEIRERLQETRVYKVGHHGSLNATPKSLWGLFGHKGGKDLPERLATMVSTLSGKHGSVSRRTEVPRRALIDELKAQSDLLNTQSLTKSSLWWLDLDLDL
jgi:hypothetical protein